MYTEPLGDEGLPGDNVYLRCSTQGPKGVKGAQGEKRKLRSPWCPCMVVMQERRCLLTISQTYMMKSLVYQSILESLILKDNLHGEPDSRCKLRDLATRDISVEELTN